MVGGKYQVIGVVSKKLERYFTTEVLTANMRMAINIHK